MKNIINDFITFIKSLSFIDILFILAVIALVILIVTLIYIIKINDEDELSYLDDELEEEDIIIKKSKKKNNIKQEINEDKKDEDDELDLVSISKELEQATNKPITLNDYEKEQEEKAIISYDELLKTKDLQEEVSYIKEQNIGGLSVKSVDVDQVTKPIELPKIREEYEKISNDNIEDTNEFEIIEDVEEEPKNILLSYEKEEEFLKTLKKLQKLLY